MRCYELLDNHYLFSFPQTAASAIARWQGVPYTVRAMGQLTAWSLRQSRLKKQLYSALIERRSLNGAAAIHCTSAQEASDVARFGVRVPTLTLPLGVRPPQPIPQAPQQLRQPTALRLRCLSFCFCLACTTKSNPTC